MHAKTRHLRLSLLSILLIAAAGCGGDFAADLATAKEAFEAGDPVRAQTLAQALMKETPVNDGQAREFAELLILLAEPGGALDVLERHASDDAPETSDIRIAALLASGALDDAEKELGRRFSKGTDTGRTSQLKGQLFFHRRKLMDAKRALLEAQGRDEKDPLTWALLGLTMAQLAERDQAEELLWEAHRRFPKSCEVRKALAGVLLPGRENLKETLEAVADLLGYVAEHRPLDLASRGRLGTVLNRLGRHLEAKRILERLTKDDPTRSAFWADLGIAYAQLEDYSSASGAFLNASTIDPTNVKLLLNLGNCYLEMADVAEDRDPPLDRAKRTFLRVIELAGDSPEALIGLGREAVKRDPADDPQAEKAIHFYRKALEIAPDSYPAHLNLALLYYDLWIPVDKTKSEGHWRAMEHFGKAAEIVPVEQWTRSAGEAYEELKGR